MLNSGLRKHSLSPKRLGDQPVRRPPALVVAGDRDDHDLVGGKLLLQLQEFLAHFARVPENKPPPRSSDEAPPLRRIAEAPSFFKGGHGRADALRHVQGPRTEARPEAP